MALISGDTIELSVTSSQHRTKTGSPYLPPESSKHNLLEGPDPDTLAHQICSSGMPALMALMSHIEGIGKSMPQACFPCRTAGTETFDSGKRPRGGPSHSGGKGRLVSGEYSRFVPAPVGRTFDGRVALAPPEPERTYGSVLDAASEFRSTSCTSWGSGPSKLRCAQCTAG